MKDNFLVGKEAQEALVRGVNKVADAVKGTLGAAGYNYIAEAFEYPYSYTSNDGVSLAKEIKVSDPYEKIGASLIQEVATRSDKQSGDGTTTATVLTQAILNEGLNAEVSPMVLKKSLEECLPIIEASIKDQTKDITVDDVGVVAAVSAEDEKIGALIQEVYQKIGKDGILYPDVSKTFEDHYTIGSGVKVADAGFVSPYMADADDKGNFLNVAKYKNVPVLITKQKITNASELNDIVKKVWDKDGRELVVFCDEIEAPAVTDLILTRARKGFKTLVIKLPVIWKDQWFDDLARLTGATVVDSAAGVTLKTVSEEHLGKVGGVITDKNDTFLDGTHDLTEYITALNEEGSDDSKIRAARLSTKTARLYVGAPTDAALKYRRLKVDDARGAAWQAMHGGIVAGGGVALWNASFVMPDTVGGNILRVALKSPLRQIVANAGAKIDESEVGIAMGFNAKTGKIQDMWDANIVDPATVVMNSTRNALSIAATVLTARVVVATPREETMQMPPRMAMM